MEVIGQLQAPVALSLGETAPGTHWVERLVEFNLNSSVFQLVASLLYRLSYRSSVV
jgi:hypothetical protein